MTQTTTKARLASLTLENLSCTYQARKTAVHALRGFCLDVADRELVVLVGPSGSGKTTSLRLVAGLDTPSQGTIRIGNRVVNDVAPRDRDVAMVFQNYALYPHMSVYKNLAFGLKMRGVARPQIEQAVQAVAAKLGLASLLDRKPHQLSGGEKQRVALGRAIVRTPQLFLLDEPLSNLDISLRAQTRAHIKSLQRELATTMMYVTHDQEEAMTLADRIAVLRDGTLQQVGTPAEIFQRPANRFVAGFFGSPAMNLIRGTITEVDGKPQFLSGRIRVPMPTSTSFVGNGASGEVTLGVRPHNVRIKPVDRLESGETTSTSRGVVRDIELLGDSATVRIVLDGAMELTAKVAPEALPRAGQSVEVDFNSGCLHWFASDEAGLRLG